MSISSSHPTSISEFVSFDGAVRRSQQCVRPDRYRDLEAMPPFTPRIVRGGGYSYAPASMGGQAVVEENSAFNRILEMDAESGILECEGGTTLARVYDVAARKGWFLPVQPGYPLITVGGCVAADVHGKNQFRDGTFRRHVAGLRLFHPRHGILELSRTARPEVFDLTCGGFGLTGRIVTVRMQLEKLPGMHVRKFSHRIRNIEEAPALMEQYALQAASLYTWHNFSATGEHFGRGFLYGAEFVPGESHEGNHPKPRTAPIDSKARGELRFQFLNVHTIQLFNFAYELFQLASGNNVTIELFDFLFPISGKVFYYKLFGKKGFHEYQMIIPRAAFREVAQGIRHYLERDRVAICLASCKLFRGDQSLLRFDGNGVCLALDFPRDTNSEAFSSHLDRIITDCGGLPNIIKDSRLPQAVVRDCYREYDVFRGALRKFDPDRIYRSETSKRLEL